MDEFDINDIVVVKFDRAGMKKGEVGIITERLDHVDMFVVMFGKNRYYMFPDQLENWAKLNDD